MERVGFLATVREAPDVTVPFEFERMLPEDRLRRVALGPLGADALHRLLRGRLGLELARPEITRVGEASGGNPFFALEIGRELARTNVALDSERPLPVPDSLGRLLGKRLERLPRGDASGPARRCSGGSADRGRGRASVWRARARRWRRSSSRLARAWLSSRTPVCASVIRCLARCATRRRRCGAAKPCTARSPASVADPEERARHLALATDRPDPGVASELDAATEHAAARGATAAAASLAELAAAMTPADRLKNVVAGASRPPGFTGSRATSSGRARSSSSCWVRSRSGSSAPMCSTRSRRRGGRTCQPASASAPRP